MLFEEPEIENSFIDESTPLADRVRPPCTLR